MRTVYPKQPSMTFNDWMKFIHEQVKESKKLKKEKK